MYRQMPNGYCLPGISNPVVPGNYPVVPVDLGSTALGTEPGTGDRYSLLVSSKFLCGSAGCLPVVPILSGSTGGSSGSIGRSRRLVNSSVDYFLPSGSTGAFGPVVPLVRRKLSND